MAHTRTRHLTALLAKALKMSPLVGLLGHRQVGKTTLSAGLCENYVTFDDAETLETAKESPKIFIQSQKKFTVIDECQLAPSLFPALKEWVRTHPKPGQFLMTGSIRFTSYEAIRESLTGRIINFELSPLILSELLEYPLPGVIKAQFDSTDCNGLFRKPPLDAKVHRIRLKGILTYYDQGGLPGVCFLRNGKFGSKKWDQQLFTILDRDIRKVTRTNLSYAVLRNLLRVLSNQQGQHLDYTQLQKDSQISIPSLKKLIYGLQAVFLIRLIPIDGGKKGEVLYFEDQGENFHLRTESRSSLDKLLHFCFVHFRAQFEYVLDEPTECFSYQTRGGAIVPLVYRNSLGVIGIIPVEDENEAKLRIPSAESLLKKYPNSKVMMVHLGSEKILFQPRIILVPITELV